MIPMLMEIKCLEVNSELIKNNPALTNVGYHEMYVCDTEDFTKQINFSTDMAFPQLGDLISDSGHLIKNKYIKDLDNLENAKVSITNDFNIFNRQKLESNRLAVIENALPSNMEMGLNKLLFKLKMEKIRSNAMVSDKPLNAPKGNNCK